RWWGTAPADLVYYLIGAGRLNEREQKEIIVLLSVLPDDINVGYHNNGKGIVTKINGRDIKSFKDFVLLVDEIKDNEQYTIIETKHKLRIILNNGNIEEINKEILKRNNVPHQFSEDVAKWLNKDD
ncbi:MAG: hypothetical protein KAR32_03965, partial [Candidatus Omnitrophica bacterium]|nr:hypothetical protein [Candidatus Omnitrophota bacterium]